MRCFVPTLASLRVRRDQLVRRGHVFNQPHSFVAVGNKAAFGVISDAFGRQS
jgi:hypothetical protein